LKEESEQKSLPASDKKLREARRKGQVSSSRDLVSGFGLFAVVVYLLFAWTLTRDQILQLIDLIGGSYHQPFTERWNVAVAAASSVVLYAAIPAVAILVVTSVVVGMAATFGPVFSFESVKPNFDHVNPASGLKRIFSMRNVVEFLKGLVKVVAMAVALWLVLRSFLQPMLQTPSCGESCVVPLLLEAMKPLIIVAILAFIVIGFFDVGVQRWLFLRDMRMTKTEMKRERKDIEGDPLILGERRRQRMVQSQLGGRLGLPAASVVIAGENELAAFRYHRRTAPLPILVAKGRGDRVAAMREEASLLGIPIVESPGLAAGIADTHGLGDHLRQEYFTDVASILVTQNLS
jgi:type III secretion protein U